MNYLPSVLCYSSQNRSAYFLCETGSPTMISVRAVRSAMVVSVDLVS